MNLTELKDDIIVTLGLDASSKNENVSEAVKSLKQYNQDVKNKAEQLQESIDKLQAEAQQDKEPSEEDVIKAAERGFVLTKAKKLFVSLSLRTFTIESYCKEKSKVYWEATKTTKGVSLLKIG